MNQPSYATLKLGYMPIKITSYKKDPKTMEGIEKLNKSKIPYDFIHIPTFKEMKDKNVNTVANPTAGSLLKSLEEISNKKSLSILDYSIDKDTFDFESLVINAKANDYHPSDNGNKYIAKKIVELISDKFK